LFHVDSAALWLEESLNEYLVHHLCPDFDSTCVRANGYLYATPRFNVLGDNTRNNRRYDVAVFWKFVAWRYGGGTAAGPKLVGDIADFAFKNCAGDMVIALAAYMKIPLAVLHRDWIQASLDLAFWRADPVAWAVAKKVFGNTKKPSAFDPKSMAWFRPTCATADEAAKRLEPMGFEVMDITGATAPLSALGIRDAWTRVFVTHYTDGSYAIGDAAPMPDAGGKGVRRALVAFGFCA
jgi:hypothetical protein